MTAPVTKINAIVANKAAFKIARQNSKLFGLGRTLPRANAIMTSRTNVKLASVQPNVRWMSAHTRIDGLMINSPVDGKAVSSIARASAAENQWISQARMLYITPISPTRIQLHTQPFKPS
jgi:hypothetical protein